MLTLLKQARAFGLGCLLSTQNPVDLDYKGLSNTGTWWLGRLQSERDKLRVLEGLEGAAASREGGFDRGKMERTLAGLDSRILLMNNVHEDAPEIFETRWVLSYLAGPLARDQIRALTANTGHQEDVPAPPAPALGAVAPVLGTPQATRPALPPRVREAFLPVTRPPAPGERIVYRPAVAAVAALHYANARARIDDWQRIGVLAELSKDSTPSPWKAASTTGRTLPELESAPREDAVFEELPAVALRAESYARWTKALETHLYREHPALLFRCSAPKLVSTLGESESAFRGRLAELTRETRDASVEKLRKRFAPKLARLQDQIARAEQRVEVETEQYAATKRTTLISAGVTLLGAVLGHKLGVGSVRRAATTARHMGRSTEGEAGHRACPGAGRDPRATPRGTRGGVPGGCWGARERTERTRDRSGDAARPRPQGRHRDRRAPARVDTPWRVGEDGSGSPAWERPVA